MDDCEGKGDYAKSDSKENTPKFASYVHYRRVSLWEIIALQTGKLGITYKNVLTLHCPLPQQ